VRLHQSVQIPHPRSASALYSSIIQQANPTLWWRE